MRYARRALLGLLFLAVPHAPGFAQGVDLEGLVAWPFPTELTAASSADVVAWVRNAAGARNVWVAEGPDWVGRAVTDFGGDDGQEITGLRVSGDGRSFVFVRGGAPNRAGEIPNPTSDPGGAEREIWAGDVAPGARQVDGFVKITF